MSNKSSLKLECLRLATNRRILRENGSYEEVCAEEVVLTADKFYKFVNKEDSENDQNQT